MEENRVKWEYITYLFGKYSSKYELVLDKYGQEGWELVSVDNGIAYFKRPIPGVKLDFKQVYDD